jgi:hypothetical protein
VRLQPPDLAALDAWIKVQDDGPSRPEAIRRLVLQAFPGRAPRQKGKASAHQASKLAAREIDSLLDKSEPAEVMERRKRRLIHGPKEFREIRGDQPKRKR